MALDGSPVDDTSGVRNAICMPMADIDRINVTDAHRKVQAHEALLVCAYADEAKCQMVNLEGSIGLKAFESQAATLPKSQEVIFFCA